MSLELLFPASATPSPEPCGSAEHAGVRLRLLGRQSLWGHVLFNAARRCADLLRAGAVPAAGLAVLELGAGSGLAAIQCALAGARRVVCNDYPTAEMRENLEHNARENLGALAGRLEVRLYKWGDRTVDLGGRFDLVLLNDCVQVLAAHEDLLWELQERTAPGGRVLVVFQHYEARKIARTEAFLGMLAGAGFAQISYSRERYGPMFPEDDAFEGHVEERSWVHAHLFERAGQVDHPTAR